MINDNNPRRLSFWLTLIGAIGVASLFLINWLTVRVPDVTVDWSVSGGAMPQGMSLDAKTGVLEGTPAGEGDYRFAVTAALSNDASNAYTMQYRMLIKPAYLKILNDEIPNGVIDVYYEAPIVSSYSQFDTDWELVGGGLPDGITLNRSNGNIRGVPTQSGIFDFTVRITSTIEDGPFEEDTRSFTLVIEEWALLVTTYSLRRATVDEPYEAVLESNYGDDVVWALVEGSGALPEGLGIDPTGVISGIPLSTGEFYFSVIAVAGDEEDSADLTLTVGIDLTAGLLLPNGSVNFPYNEPLDQDDARDWVLVDGTLPPGLIFDESIGFISGVPEERGSFTFTVSSVTGFGEDEEIRTLVYSIRIESAEFRIMTNSLHDGIDGEPYSFRLRSNHNTYAETVYHPFNLFTTGFNFDLLAGYLSHTGLVTADLSVYHVLMTVITVLSLVGFLCLILSLVFYKRFKKDQLGFTGFGILIGASVFFMLTVMQLNTRISDLTLDLYPSATALGYGAFMCALASIFAMVFFIRPPIKELWGKRVFDFVLYVVMCIMVIIFIFPFFYMFALSTSGADALRDNKVWLLPIGFNVNAYLRIFEFPNFFNAYRNTLFYTSAGTMISMSMMLMFAYPLSKSFLHGRKMIMRLVIFSMLFSGGLIPQYLLIRNLGLANTVWGILLPFGIQQFLLIILINFLRSIPQEIEEAAIIDGMGYFGILTKIVVPLSTPAIATVSLYVAVFFWNDWLYSLLFLNTQQQPVMRILRNIVVGATVAGDAAGVGDTEIAEMASKAAVILVAVIPIIVIYPFLQRFFVKGLTLGGVKG